MSNFTSRPGATFGLFALSCTLAAAQNPTFSLEAVAVNGVKIPGGPVAKVSVAPGATVTFELYVRDWSPAGEPFRAYQAQLDVDGYTNGLAGAVKPLDFANTTEKKEENRANCFIDITHPKFVFKGKDNFAIADTRSFGYRWMSLLTHESDAIVSDQKGEKFYCGTVRMKVSDDARGTFRPRLLPGEGNTTLRDPMSLAILPVDIEDALVEVLTGKLAMVSSDPPRGAIDARTSAQGRSGGWDQVALTFNGDTASLSGSDFTVTDGSPNPPRIVAVTSEGSVIRLKLDRGIAPGRWTTILHRDSATETRIGCLPGDANHDGEVNTADLFDLLESSVGKPTVSPADIEASPQRFDVTGDGRADLTDALHVLDVLARPGAFRSDRLELMGR